MKNFIGYHGEARWGEFLGGDFFTARRYRRETLIGNRLWIILGVDKSTRYFRIDSGIIVGVRDEYRPQQFRRPDQDKGLTLLYETDFGERVDITDLRWFQLVRERLHFGLQPAPNNVLEGLLEYQTGEARIQDDLREIRSDSATNATTKKALVDARLGQESFEERSWTGGTTAAPSPVAR